LRVAPITAYRFAEKRDLPGVPAGLLIELNLTPIIKFKFVSLHFFFLLQIRILRAVNLLFEDTALSIRVS
jgi:hypothetical protein